MFPESWCYVFAAGTPVWSCFAPTLWATVLFKSEQWKAFWSRLNWSGTERPWTGVCLGVFLACCQTCRYTIASSSRARLECMPVFLHHDSQLLLGLQRLLWGEIFDWDQSSVCSRGTASDAGERREWDHQWVCVSCDCHQQYWVCVFVCVQVPEYLHHVARRLEEENDRIVSYLDQSTQ